MTLEYTGSTYRITGAHSIERIEPLLLGNLGELKWEKVVRDFDELQLDFVWETNCEKSFKSLHDRAIILNRLHNSSIIEDKSNMAFLQIMMNVPVLETFIAKTSDDVKRWCETKWELSNEDLTDNSRSSASDWWAVKASRGNGGKDVFVSHHSLLLFSSTLI